MSQIWHRLIDGWVGGKHVGELSSTLICALVSVMVLGLGYGSLRRALEAQQVELGAQGQQVSPFDNALVAVAKYLTAHALINASTRHRCKHHCLMIFHAVLMLDLRTTA